MGFSNELSCEAGSFSCQCNPHRFSQPGILRISPCWNPGLCGLSCSPFVPPGLSACKCGTTRSSSCHLAASPPLPSCLSLPLLWVLMNVSSLTYWLLDFYTVQFSGSSGSLFLNLLLSFFWLCEEAKCIYLHHHLGWQSLLHYFPYK